MNTSYRILAATDFSPDAANAVERAAMLARELGAQLRLLHVVSEPSVIQLRAGLRSGTDIERLLVRDAHQSMEKIANRLRAHHALTVVPQVEVGPVLDMLQLAMKQSDLLVVGPRGLHPTQDLFIGSMAERL
jgi:nucleotide-binding universal stress UspA family protein